jgi:hypothetical protein
VRSAAEVYEGTVAIQRHGFDTLVANEIFDELHLVRLILGAEAVDRLGGRQLRALKRLVGGDVFAHRLLDPIQVGFGRSGAVRKLEVVIEAVGDRRPDRDLRAGPEIEHRSRHHVRRVMAQQPERVGVVAGRDDLDLGAVWERSGEIAQLAVHPQAERVLGESRADRRSRVGAGGAVVELEWGVIGELDRDRGHRAAMLSAAGASAGERSGSAIPRPGIQIPPYPDGTI